MKETQKNSGLNFENTNQQPGSPTRGPIAGTRRTRDAFLSFYLGMPRRDRKSTQSRQQVFAGWEFRDSRVGSIIIIPFKVNVVLFQEGRGERDGFHLVIHSMCLTGVLPKIRGR